MPSCLHALLLRYPLVIVLFSFCLGSGLQAQDGIYADFTTSLGKFSCRLHYDKAPRTVANFIGLASGSRSWLDIPTGEVKRTPFYDGLTFHRVIQGFVIQGGSPNGNGTDGPGYTFKDEFDPSLHHQGAGVLSMANSGLHSNGSQFFVTLSTQSHLDNVHSIFGAVTDQAGLNTIQAIGAAATDANAKPTVPIIIQSIAIRRVGAAAIAFDERNQGLPAVGGADPVLLRAGDYFGLHIPRALFSEYYLYSGADLRNWSRSRIALYTSNPVSSDIDVTSAISSHAKYFYRVPEIAYPGPLYTPAALAGATLTLNTTVGVIVYVFDATGTSATCTYNSTTGSVVSKSWTQEAYRGRLFANQTNIVPIQVDCAFATATSGSVRGTAQTATPTTFTGTFTFSSP